MIPLTEFQKKNGWLDDFTWLEKKYTCSYNEIYNRARKYKHKSDFYKNDKKGYDLAYKHNWLKDYSWFIPKLLKESCNSGNTYWIYGYFDFKNKTCYIGLSRDKNRHWRHKQKDKNGNFDSVMKYFYKKYGYLPEPTIIENDLTAEIAQEKESYYINFFKEKGYIVLNKIKAGSLGSAVIKWNKKSCYDEAKKYTKYDDFYNLSATAYRVAKKNKWFDDYTWLKRKRVKRGFWQNYKNCYNAARECSNLSEFDRKYPGAYKSSNIHGWLKGYTWFFQKNSGKILLK